ncbi:MAG: aminotransferase class III-fold pyridoxal phosphate-dependent enzyme, partial [Anaerolineae bacterium]
GAEVGCYAALEVLNILQEPGFLEHVRQMAAFFRDGLAALKQRHPKVLVEVRQRGMMMGLRWANEMCGPMMTLAGFRYGLLLIYANHDQSVSQFLPPLIIQEEEAQQVLEILERMVIWLEKTIQTG